MHMTLRKTLLAAFAVGIATACFSLASWSMGDGERRDPEQILERMTQRLALTEIQRDAVRTIVIEDAQQFRKDRERLFELRQSLRETRVDFDAGEAQRMADEIGELSSRLSFAHASIQARIYLLLTPEQRQEFDALLERREQRRERWRENYLGTGQRGTAGGIAL